MIMKLGIIDHHLNNYHANKFHGLLTGEVGKEAGGVEIVAAYESHPVGEDWCTEKGVPRASSAAEVVTKSDAILILAPDNSEAHPELSREALASRKPVFFDKALAANMSDAQQIVQAAREHDTAIMTASSLRFSVELEELLQRINGRPVDGIYSRGLAKWRGYSVHTISPVMRLLGGDRIKRLIDTSRGGAARIVTLETATGRRALIDVRESENQFEATPWQIGVLVEGRYETITIKQFDEFYANLMRQTLQFFKTRQSPVPVEEQLEILAVELAADASVEKGSDWVSLPL